MGGEGEFQKSGNTQSMLMYSRTMLTWIAPTGMPQGAPPAGHPPVPAGVVAPLVPIPCSKRPQALAGGLEWSDSESVLYRIASVANAGARGNARIPLG